MRLLIVRHGETEANINGAVAGQSDSRLTARGFEQARRLGERLRGESVDGIYASDLQRARATAAEIARCTGGEVRHDARLRERSFGVFEGLPAGCFLEAHEASGVPYHEFAPEGGESLEMLRVRIESFLADLRPAERSGSALICSHLGPNKVILHVLLGWEWGRWHEHSQGNTALHIVEFDGSGQARLSLSNCSRHLDDTRGSASEST